VGRRFPAGLFFSAALALLLAAGARASALEAVTADGRFVVRDDGRGELAVIAASDGRELRRIPLVDRQRRAGRVAWIIDLPRRQSLLVGFGDLPEAWELPYGERAEPVYDGLVHDYRMGEGIADRGPLPVRRIPLEAPMPRPTPDEREIHVSWPDPAMPGRRLVLNLDVRRLVAAAGSRPAPVPTVQRIDHVDVVAAASRVEESADAVPTPVSSIGRVELFREVATDLRGALRYEPGLSFESGSSRFGLGQVNIRGLEGNRVQMTVDGIRLPESYRVGSFSNASRNALGVGLLRNIEVVRGPASAIHGSDALAGVLAFTTIDPASYLRDGRTLGGEAFAAANEADGATSRGGALAMAAGDSRMLVAAERTDGHETSNRGDIDSLGASRTTPNPQHYRSESQLAKWTAGWPAGWRTVATAERFARDARTDVRSLNPQSSRTTSLTGDDHARRTRYSVEAIGYGVGPFARLSLTAYAQGSLTQQDTEEIRANVTATCLSTPGTVRCLREPRFRYDARERGLVAIGELEGRRWGLEHRMVVGAEVSRTRAAESRDGRQTNLVTGAVTNVVGGEALPTRDFPITDTDRLGLFVQDAVTAPGSSLAWIPGLRFDAFRLSPKADAVFAAGNPGRGVVGLEDRAISPKLGMLAPLTESLTLTGQLATGFRAPPAADLNIGLTSLPAGYAVVPNPDLKPETSRGAEAGLRWKRDDVEASVSAYHTRYRDLIVSRGALACPADPRCVPGATGTFQSQNVSSARIYGLEGQARWRFARGWTARAAFSAPRGDDLTRDLPLNSVDPARAVLGLGYDAARWGAAMHVTHAKSPSRVDRSTGLPFVPPAWTTVDLTAWFKPVPALEIAVGVFNAGDRKYWLWNDVRGLSATAGAFDRYTQPGRNAGISARYAF
jgi:hemoglobin/transferrin/lactoferrin receptor protein